MDELLSLMPLPHKVATIGCTVPEYSNLLSSKAYFLNIKTRIRVLSHKCEAVYTPLHERLVTERNPCLIQLFDCGFAVERETTLPL